MVNASCCMGIRREEEWHKIAQAIVGTKEGSVVSLVRPSLAVGFIMMLFAYGLF